MRPFTDGTEQKTQELLKQLVDLSHKQIQPDRQQLVVHREVVLMC